jgi:hypothetical protein
MMRLCAALAGLCLAGAAAAQEASDGPGGTLRVLDKVTGIVSDVDMRRGETRELGYLSVTLNACRYPTLNPSGDAYAELTVWYQGGSAPLFDGWMIASAPALNAMEHPRYDVWVLRCTTS